MNALTSISPAHHNGDQQRHAIESWVAAGLTPVSFNGHAEVERLAPLYPQVRFVPTYRTMERLFGRPYVSISAMLDHAKGDKDDVALLINSDIILRDAREVLERYARNEARKGVCVIKRVDYTSDFADGDLNDHAHRNGLYEVGMDAFLIPRELLPIYPQSVYCMGQTWWDFWVPWVAIKNRVPVYQIRERIAFHKMHPIQYREDEWVRMTRYFEWENGRHPAKHPGMTTGNIYNDIKDNMIR